MLETELLILLEEKLKKERKFFNTTSIKDKTNFGLLNLLLKKRRRKRKSLRKITKREVNKKK